MAGGPNEDDKFSRRLPVALIFALCAHVVLAVITERASIRVAVEDESRIVVDLIETVVVVPPVEDIVPPDDVIVETPVVNEPPVKIETPKPTPVVEEPPPAKAAAPIEAPPIVTDMPATDTPSENAVVLKEGTPSSEDLLRRRPDKPGTLDRVLGKDPFGTSLKDLEGALDFKTDGPMSDGKRAALNAKRFIETGLSEDAVVVGLVDDYFRELKVRMETAWQPAVRDLNDGGDSTSRVGFVRDFAVNRAAWGEMLKLYLDVAEQYGKAEKLSVDRARVERMRELFRSKRGNFRFHAISEVILTQAPDGSVLTLEFPITSGHPGIDEGIKDAFIRSVAVMPYAPPERLHHGRSFKSKWRLRATWRMIPPTALLTGTGFDISAKGVEVDMPFEIKLTTKVFLLDTKTLEARDD